MFKVVDPDSSVYVELSLDGQTSVQEFAPGEERAFVVGSTDHASLRVSSSGVAPVQFHIEREDGSIWLIPAYGIADLSVDWIRVIGPTPLDARSVIEFCDVRIHATLVEADPLATDDDRFTVPRSDAPASHDSYPRNLPGEEDPTLVAMQPVCADEPVVAPSHEIPTRVDRTREQSELVGSARASTESRWSLSDDVHLSATTKPGRSLARRGSRPRRRTLLVIAGAGIGAFVLALTLLAARVFERHRATTAAGTATMIDTKSR